MGVGSRGRSCPEYPDGPSEFPPLPRPGDQGSHVDEDPDYFREFLHEHPPDDAPLSFLLALMPETRLRLRLPDKSWTVIYLDVGDILLFRGDVYHGGVGYRSGNVRVHGHVYAIDYHPPEPSSIYTEEATDSEEAGGVDSMEC